MLCVLTLEVNQGHTRRRAAYMSACGLKVHGAMVVHGGEGETDRAYSSGVKIGSTHVSLIFALGSDRRH